MAAHYTRCGPAGKEERDRAVAICAEGQVYCRHHPRGAPMPTLTVEQVESRLTAVRCAICKASAFTIDRRSMQADGEWKGACLKCRYTFPVHTNTEFYLRTQPDMPYRLRAIGCPKCEKRGVDLDFRIDMSVREAVYFVTCRACGHLFAEPSSMEAFE